MILQKNMQIIKTIDKYQKVTKDRRYRFEFIDTRKDYTNHIITSYDNNDSVYTKFKEN